MGQKKKEVVPKKAPTKKPVFQCQICFEVSASQVDYVNHILLAHTTVQEEEDDPPESEESGEEEEEAHFTEEHQPEREEMEEVVDDLEVEANPFTEVVLVNEGHSETVVNEAEIETYYEPMDEGEEEVENIHYMQESQEIQAKQDQDQGMTAHDVDHADNDQQEQEVTDVAEEGPEDIPGRFEEVEGEVITYSDDSYPIKIPSSNKRGNQCPECQRVYTTHLYFKMHWESKCGKERKFVCDICQLRFISHGSLKAHILIHTDEKNFKCTFCPKTFLSAGQLKVHTRLHTKEKPFKCSVCPKSFSYRESLVTHSSVHTGVLPYACLNCDRKFSCVGNLIKHRKTRMSTCGLPQFCQNSRAGSRPSTRNPQLPLLMRKAGDESMEENDSIRLVKSKSTKRGRPKKRKELFEDVVEGEEEEEEEEGREDPIQVEEEKVSEVETRAAVESVNALMTEYVIVDSVNTEVRKEADGQVEEQSQLVEQQNEEEEELVLQMEEEEEEEESQEQDGVETKVHEESYKENSDECLIVMEEVPGRNDDHHEDADQQGEEPEEQQNEEDHHHLLDKSDNLIEEEVETLKVIPQKPKKSKRAKPSKADITALRSLVTMTRFECQKCLKSFALEKSLQKHESTSCGQFTLHMCAVCKKGFASAATLKTHMSCHTDERQYVCSGEGCDKQFRTPMQLKVHERTHTGVRPYKCDLCERAFAHRETLLTHQSVHTGYKRFLCISCGKRFSCISNLQAHRRARKETCGRYHAHTRPVGENEDVELLMLTEA